MVGGASGVLSALCAHRSFVGIAILTSFNRYVEWAQPQCWPLSEPNFHFSRNFKSRNDGNSKTMNFLASPEIVTAMAFSGDLSFNPMRDSLLGVDGKPFTFAPPAGSMLPSDGFTPGASCMLQPWP